MNGPPDDEDPISAAPFASDDTDEIFNASEVPVFSVTFAEGKWEQLQEDALLEEYVEAELNYADKDIGSIGVRFKGAYGSLVLCFDAQGNQICPKLSMKLKFDETDPAKRFYGMKRINFHAMVRDPSKLHDKISYQLFREMGVIAPRSSWARLEVNGESLGLFALVEEIDGRFTEDRWPDDGDGNLYKEAWPLTSSSEHYANALETNEETATHETYVSFFEELSQASAADLPATLDNWMDRDQLYKYMAVSDAIGNWDGVTAWYCSGSACGNHNYFMYQHALEDRFTLIPWDLDSTLSPSTPFDHIPHWTDPGDCDTRYVVFGSTEARSAGCDPLFQALAADRTRYEDAIDELLQGLFQADDLRVQIDEHVALISDEIANDPTLNGTLPWLSAVERLKSDLDLLVEKISTIRDGDPVVPQRLDPAVITDFEDASRLQIATGVTSYSNTASSASFGLNLLDPLAGTRDVRFDFTYRDEGTTAWGQWAVFRLSLLETSQDLSSLTGVRFLIRGDAGRVVRVDLDSGAYSDGDSGAKFGWEITLDEAGSEVSLKFLDSAYPVWATPNADELVEVLAACLGLAFTPAPRGRDGTGFLGAGVEDSGFVIVDDVEFF